MFCPNCGNKIEGVEKSCTQCGAPLRGAVGVKSGGSSRWLKIVGIVGGVILILGAVIGALLIGRETLHSSPEAVVRSFLEAYFEKGDAQQILDVIDPQFLAEEMRDYKLEMDEIREAGQHILDGVQQQREVGYSYSFEIEETTSLNGGALVEWTLRVSHPEQTFVDEDTYFISTVERGGRWYLGEIPW